MVFKVWLRCHMRMCYSLIPYRKLLNLYFGGGRNNTYVSMQHSCII